MARLLLLFAFLVLPALVSSQTQSPFRIHGQVYCDTCRAGFETSKTTYIRGAIVKIECKDRKSLQPMYTTQGVTGENGKFILTVNSDRQDQICNTVLVSSPISDCRTPDPGRNRSEIILTGDNGAVSNVHFANQMGFLKDKPLPGCAELIKKLLYSDS
ncbi:hypothetical protein HS088_TW05G00090 [Tripterygium wilfordii]|uniref:Uncharacterized protein n=1 Tax=Tripterygium wilfordii TaxID=458696 RepID=A0A7J7DM59_TRIWF|nr:protein DOWNSTREAM OF FLC-like [Tripterygium wilfordii]KAF5747369.1 hypothetical protein HS088_TW05G00090 [Tripterygium wilfordii]